ncbi:MAG: hypothetical protein JW776_06720 [Candidatus Lokiarchaeota archaeon]|nr:hypothetical protein [Candidatus Lokiarchaeota archaeon]
MDKDRERKKHIVERISTLIGIIWVFIGVITGVIFPMLYIIPMLFSSWILFGSFGVFSWANTYLLIDYQNPRIFVTLYVVEGIIFLVGLMIFCSSLAYLVKGRYRKQKLVTNGPYKYIRHPQNLGILLMIFPFTLLVPFSLDPGIRFGDFMSWILMVTLMSISATIEEKLLISKIGQNYVTYRTKTGFFFPKIRKKLGRGDFILWKYVLLILGIYCCVTLICFGINQLLLKLDLVGLAGAW